MTKKNNKYTRSNNKIIFLNGLIKKSEKKAWGNIHTYMYVHDVTRSLVKAYKYISRTMIIIILWISIITSWPVGSPAALKILGYMYNYGYVIYNM